MFHTFPTRSGIARAMKIARHLAIVLLASVTLSAPAACSQGGDTSRSTRRAITQSQAIATDFLRTELALSPETASRLDLERVLGPTAIYQLDNHSQAGFERRRLVRIELMQRLQQRPALPEGHVLARDLAIAEAALVDLISLEQLGYGRFSYAEHRPYAVDAFSGIWIEGAAMLAYQQTINNTAEATAYVARLQAMSEAVQDTRRRLLADRASGIILPLDLARESQARVDLLLSDDPSALSLLVTTFAALTLDLDDLDADQRETMISLVSNEVETKLRPALEDLSETLGDVTGATTDQAGIWAQPTGQALYSGIVRALTGETPNTERLHARHVEDVETMRAALERMLVVPETEEDPVLEERPTELGALLPWFESQVTVPAEPMVDPVAEPAAPRRPEIIRRLAPVSIWALIENGSTFTAQEARFRDFRAIWSQQPYLTWRTEGEGELSAQRELVEYPAIQDAWRLYIWTRQTEDIDPAIDPADRVADQSIRLIQSVLSAADTGLHLDRWTLDETTDFIVVQTGLSEPLARQLALRIMAQPGYHTAVALAFHRFEILSERAAAVLGTRYSETDFQRTLIQAGPRPLPFIEIDIEAWYGARLSN